MITCSQCKKEISAPQDGVSSGYGLNSKNEKVCYACCGVNDAEFMRYHGKMTLYLANGLVTNWPNSLTFTPTKTKTGRHNIAGSRTDVWFRGPDGASWYGVNYGDNTQILHCKKLKEVRRG